MSISDPAGRTAPRFVRWYIGTGLAVLAAGSTAAIGAGLQVSPVTISITERSGVVWLTNTTAKPLRAQVRVYRWTQVNSENQLVPTEEVLASPPFVDIQPSEQHVVRLVRRLMPDEATAPCEEAYRLKIDELPDPDPTPPRGGIRYRLSYSVPVFLTSERCVELEPQLSWQMSSGTIRVTNTGNRTAQLAGAYLVAANGQRQELSGGLIGYVLPGSNMTFAIAQNPRISPTGGNLEVMVNGRKVTQALPLASAGQ